MESYPGQNIAPKIDDETAAKIRRDHRGKGFVVKTKVNRWGHSTDKWFVMQCSCGKDSPLLETGTLAHQWLYDHRAEERWKLLGQV